MSQICWYLAAVVQVQLCKYFIEIGDSERESTVWGEINVLRFVSSFHSGSRPMNIGHLDLQCWSTEVDHPSEVSILSTTARIWLIVASIIVRQERLLQGLMQEIVRITAQKQPLEVGVPLFPFSHAGLFRKNEPAHASPDQAAMPLPVSPPYEDGMSPSLPHPVVTTNAPNVSVPAWPIHDISVSPGKVDVDILGGSSGF